MDDNYRDPFDVASDDSGKLLFTNQITASAEITYRVTNPLLFDSKFNAALAWKIALEIAPSLTGNNQSKIISNAQANYSRALASAGASAMNEGHVSNAPYYEFMRERE